MNRPRTIASAAVLATLSLGVATPANAAILGHPHGHSATVKVHSHASHGSSQAVAQVLRDLAHLDKRLARVAQYPGVGRLSAPDQATVLANIAADRAALATQADQVRAAGTVADVKAARRDLRQVRPTNYILATNALLGAARLTSQVGTLSSQVQAGSVEAGDLADATSQIALVETEALAVTARSTKADLHAIHAAADTALTDVDAVSSALGTSSTTP